MSFIIKEACVETVAEAIRAGELGADRLELCDNLALGGTTPSPETVIACKIKLQIPLMVMIRPRGGNFVYTPDEVDLMLREINFYKLAGADGIVTGALTPSGNVDFEILHRLVKKAAPMQVTFHKAIDETRDILKELKKLAETGIHRVLTSGGFPTAMEGIGMLNKMVRLTEGKLIILAAGKITGSNIQELSMQIHTHEFHGRKIVGDLT